MLKLNQAPHWQVLQKLASQYQSAHLKDLFVADPNRFEDYSLSVQNILFDYSKNCLTPEIMEALIGLTSDMGLQDAIDDMFLGVKINTTESRAVLHTALRNQSDAAIQLDGKDIKAQVGNELAKIRTFTDKVNQGQWLGFTGKPITDVVNIGIGGSNLGPKMVTEALAAYAHGSVKVHFVSNVDGVEISQVLHGLNPEQVLFVVASKTFTTSETMQNAATARQWLLDAANNDESAIANHFVAVSTNTQAIQQFGIDSNNTFTMWDWVGGRYSLWSSIGLSIALYIGFEKFIALLAGAHDMDAHFKTSEFEQNAPVLLALIGIWNGLLHGSQSHAILPYDQPLKSFANYIQQADMESNGKHVDKNGYTVDYQTAPIIWGQLGIDGQHAFYQLLHQGNIIVPADFIGSVHSSMPVDGHHENLMANFFAQSEALMQGIDAQTVQAQLETAGMSAEKIRSLALHKVHEGNRPSNTLLLDCLDPRTLGALIALYEHKIFVQGVIWDICSFDQWGVELGKTLAKDILEEINGEATNQHDASTNGLIAYFKQKRSG